MLKAIVIALLVLSIGVDFTSKLLSITADGIIIGAALLLWKISESSKKET